MCPRAFRNHGKKVFISHIGVKDELAVASNFWGGLLDRTVTNTNYWWWRCFDIEIHMDFQYFFFQGASELWSSESESFWFAIGDLTGHFFNFNPLYLSFGGAFAKWMPLVGFGLYPNHFIWTGSLLARIECLVSITYCQGIDLVWCPDKFHHQMTSQVLCDAGEPLRMSIDNPWSRVTNWESTLRKNE